MLLFFAFFSILSVPLSLSYLDMARLDTAESESRASSREMVDAVGRVLLPVHPPIYYQEELNLTLFVVCYYYYNYYVRLVCVCFYHRGCPSCLRVDSLRLGFFFSSSYCYYSLPWKPTTNRGLVYWFL